jgi:hypothetical protein
LQFVLITFMYAGSPACCKSGARQPPIALDLQALGSHEKNQ